MKIAVIALSVAILLSQLWAKEGSQIGTGAEIAAPEAAATAKGAAEIGATVAAETLMPAAIVAPEVAGFVGTGAFLPSGAEIFGPALSGAAGLSSLVSGAKTAATILSPVTSLVQAASGANAARAAGTRAGGATPIINAPAVTPPVTMPTFGTVDTLNAMRANIQQQLVRRGRAATILTSETGSGTKLGN